MRLADRNFVVMLFGIFKAVDICIKKANISTMFDIENIYFLIYQNTKETL